MDRFIIGFRHDLPHVKYYEVNTDEMSITSFFETYSDFFNSIEVDKSLQTFVKIQNQCRFANQTFHQIWKESDDNPLKDV